VTTGDAVAPKHRAPKRQRRRLRVWQEALLLVAVALVLAVAVKAFFLQAFYIPSASMEPGLQGGPGVRQNDRVLVEKPSYWFGRSPHEGDVIVFADPGGWLAGEDEQSPSGFAGLLAKVGLYPTGGHLVKRVIGTPGDVIHCCDAQGRIEINGHAVDESSFLNHDPGPGACDAVLGGGAIAAGTRQAAPCDWTVGPVPAGKLFVMGDNRSDSLDSRSHLCAPSETACATSPWVPEDLVVGKVFALAWPSSRWTWIGRPAVFDHLPAPS
jgi:signal peptidase I